MACLPGTIVDNLLGEILFTMYIIFTGTFDIWLEFFYLTMIHFNKCYTEKFILHVHVKS